MKIAHTAVLPLLLLLIFSPAAMSSALSPSGPSAYIVFVSRADYFDSVDYDLRLLASVVGRSVALTTTAEAKTALLYHYSSIGFAARLAPEHAHRLSKKGGVAVFKDKTLGIQEDGVLPGFFKQNV